MEALLRTPAFQQELKDARVEALLAVHTAVEPNEAALAAAAHAALAPLVLAPGALRPLADFQEAFLAAALPPLCSDIVEETLLRTLWRD